MKPGKAVRVAIVSGKTATAQFANRPMLAEPKNPPKVLRRRGSRTEGMGTICIEKYNDLNNNGVKDGGEPPLAGWQFILWHYTVGNMVSGSTGADGMWCPHTEFADATYLAKEVAQANWTNTDPIGPAMKWVPVWANETTTVQFGNRYVPPPPPPDPPKPIEFCFEKFNDLNGDGVRQTNEPGLANWQFLTHLPLAMSGFSFPQYYFSDPTTNTGTTCFKIGDSPGEWPWPGTYPVSEWPQAGWIMTTLQAGYHLVQAWYGDSFSLQFGNKQDTPEYGELCVRKYEDLDGDKAPDPNEPGLAGWTFTVSSGATGVTKPSGRVCWTLPIGGYTVSETMQPGWISSDPGGATPSKPVYITAGQQTLVQFGNRRLPPPKLGKVCARKYNDVNGSGSWQAGEPFMPGVTFTVTDNTGQVVASGVTAALGMYCTPDTLPAGNYTITETVPSGWMNTEPAGTPSAAVTVTLPQGVPPQPRFGNRTAMTGQPNLEMKKTRLASGNCYAGQSGANVCIFRFSVTNTGSGTYTGPLSISDTVMVGSIPLPVSVVTPPTGWTCSSGTVTPTVCSVGSASIAPNATVTFDLALHVNPAVLATKNCAILSWGNQQAAQSCVQITQ